jgi:hypothetical protein
VTRPTGWLARRRVPHAITDEHRDLVAEAVDATASAYTDNPDLDVRHHLAQELERRGVGDRGEDWVAQMAAAVRAGHSGDLIDEPSRQFPTS